MTAPHPHDIHRDDLPLRQALQGLPPPVDPQRLVALQDRVLAQWQHDHRHARPQHNGRSLSLRNAPRRAWVVASGLVIGVSLALGLWLKRPDPVMEELQQPDVLSQMAIGEM